MSPPALPPVFPCNSRADSPRQASLASLILCLPWKSNCIFLCISQEPQMKATTNLYEQPSGFLSNPLFYSQPFGGHVHRCATRCTPLAKQLIQLAAGAPSSQLPKSRKEEQKHFHSFHYSTNCSNAKLLHLIRDGNPPPNSGRGAPQHFSCELKKQLTWRSKRQSLNWRQIVIL